MFRQLVAHQKQHQTTNVLQRWKDDSEFAHGVGTQHKQKWDNIEQTGEGIKFD